MSNIDRSFDGGDWQYDVPDGEILKEMENVGVNPNFFSYGACTSKLVNFYLDMQGLQDEELLPLYVEAMHDFSAQWEGNLKELSGINDEKWSKCLDGCFDYAFSRLNPLSRKYTPNPTLKNLEDSLLEEVFTNIVVNKLEVEDIAKYSATPKKWQTEAIEDCRWEFTREVVDEIIPYLRESFEKTYNERAIDIYKEFLLQKQDNIKHPNGKEGDSAGEKTIEYER